MVVTLVVALVGDNVGGNVGDNVGGNVGDNVSGNVSDAKQEGGAAAQENAQEGGGGGGGNKMLLWHGSRLSNMVGILSEGLRIAPKSAPSTGFMFGKVR